MITAGIDMGAKTAKVVIVKDNKVLGSSLIPTGFDPLEAAEKAMDEAAKTPASRGKTSGKSSPQEPAGRPLPSPTTASPR
jgi:activator of 2-hydroxyglutaryl-CoA dehydratase